MKLITLLLLTSLFISSTYAQTEYRVGLGLLDITDISVVSQFSYPIGAFTTWQVANSLFLERQNKRITHRASARYFNTAHSLKNSDFRPDSDLEYKGDFSRWAWDAGYTFLYNLGPKKRLSFGAGVYYLQDHQKSYGYGPWYVDDLNQSVAASLGMEGNLKLMKTWYLNPSICLTTTKSIKYQNNAIIKLDTYRGNNRAYLTFFKLSLKKVIYIKE